MIRRWFGVHVRAAVLTFAFSFAAGSADAVELSFPQAPLVSPSAADTYYASRSVTAEAPPTAANSDAELGDVARALNNSPDLIYEFVRNNVHFEPTFGLQKGALGTLIDRSGNGFDQANLFVRLVRAGGGAARFVYGDVTLNGAAFAEWFELTSARAACELLANGGIPAIVNGQSSCGSVSGSVSTITLRHVWAQAQIGGVWYDFDPARKVYQRFAPINLAAAMGYSSTASILAAAGGNASTVAGAPARSGNSPSGVASQMATYANALINSLRANGYDAPIEEIVGGHRLVPWRAPIGGLRQTGLGYASSVATWSDVPNAYRATLLVRAIHKIREGEVLMDETLFADEIYGRRLTLDRVGTTAGNQIEGGVLRIDGIDIATFDVNLDEQWPQAFQAHLKVTADHPYAAAAGAFADETVQVDSTTALASALTIVHGWGDSSGSLAAKLGSERLGNASFRIGSPGLCFIPLQQGGGHNFAATESTEATQLGYALAAQIVQASEMQANIARARRQVHHQIGFAYTETTWENSCNYYGPPPYPTPSQTPNQYVIADSRLLVDMHAVITVVHADAAQGERIATQFAIAAAAGMLEGSVGEQVTDTTAPGSVVERYEWASTQLPSNRFVLVDASNAVAVDSAIGLSGGQDTSAGRVSFSVEGNIFGPGTEQGPRRDPNSTMPNWSTLERGAASVSFALDGSYVIHNASVRSHEARGSGTTPSPAFDPATAASLLAGARNRRDPIYGVSREGGDLTYNPPPDISVGGAAPYGLSFQRRFAGGGVKAHGFAAGWTHNWDYGVEMSGSGGTALGDGSPLAASSSIAAMVVTLDLYRAMSGAADQDTLRRNLAAFWVQHWWREYLQFNVATVTLGGEPMTFTRLPNGEFLPPAGVEASLTQFGARRIDFVYGSDGPQVVDTKTQFYDDQVWFRFRRPTGEEIDFRHRANLAGSTTPNNYISNGNTRDFLATQIRTPFGVTTNFVYAGARLTQVSNSLGHSLTFGYTAPTNPSPTDFLSRLTSVSAAGDGGTRQATFTFTDIDHAPATGSSVPPAPGRAERVTGPLLLTATAPDSSVTRYEYTYAKAGAPVVPYEASAFVGVPRDDLRPRLRRIFTANDQNNARETFVYSREGRVDTVTNARSNAWSYRTVPGFRSAHADPAGGTSVTTFALSGHERNSVDASNRRTMEFLDGLGRVRETRLGYVGYSDGRYDQRTTFTYDARHNRLTQTRHPRTDASGAPLAGAMLTRSWEFNDANWPTLPTREVDEESRAVVMAYSPTTSMLTTRTGPGAEDTDFEYNGLGLVTAQIVRINGGASRRTEWTYDSAGQVLMARVRHPSTSANDLVTTFDWTNAGNLLRITDPRGGVTEGAYDTARRLTTLTREPSDSAARQTTAIAYDAEGQVTTIRRAVVASPSFGADSDWLIDRFDYDLPGLLTEHRDPANDLTAFEYDNRDWFFAEIDPTNRRTELRYSAAGELTCERRAVGTGLVQSTRAMSISVYGAVDGYWPARGANDNCSGLNNAYRTQIAFDAYGRANATTYPDGSDVLETFTASDLPASRQTRADQAIALGYDGSGRLHTTTTPEGVYTNTYDDEGKRTNEAFAPAGGSGLLARSTGYAFDFAGRLASETAIEGALSSAVTYSYDRNGNRTAIRWPDGWTARYVWDKLGQLRQVWADPDGSAPCGGGLDACGDAFTGSGDEVQLAGYTYDRVGRVTRREHGAGVSRIDIAYEPDSDIDSVTHVFSGETAGFDYSSDAAGRLTGEVTSANGWLWTTASAATRNYGTANTLDQYAAVAGESMSWDANGNLSAWGARSFTHDSENRLRSATVGGVTSAYEYDPSGRRVRRASEGVVTRFLSAGAEEIAELDASGAVLRRFVPGAGTDQPVAYVEGGGVAQRYYYHADRQGSIIAMANASGARVERYRYAPYGVESDLVLTGQPYRYTGRRFDPETGLFHYRARMYAPGLGRFLETDPVGYADQMNLYAYVGNDPLNATDPTGEIAETVWDVINIGIGVYSLQDNIRNGEWGWAAVDAVGLAYDGVATAVPFLPAGASAGINALRAGNSVKSAVNVASDVAAVASATDRAASAASASGGAARRGTQIHSQVADAVDGSLSSSAVNHLRGANGATGPQPDLTWSDSPGVWADVTTAGQWGAHQSRYSSAFGEGTGILYEAGRGVVNSTRLRSGAGTVAAGGQLTSDSNSCSTDRRPPCR